MLNTIHSGVDGQLPVDPSWFLDINSFARATAWLHGPVTAYAKYGVVLFAGLLLTGWWVARGSRDVRAMATALWAPVGTLVAVALNQPLVNGVDEARPYTALPHVLVLVSRSSDYSFPSDHAVMAGAVAAGLFLLNRRLGVVAVLAAMLMAFARVYVGAHYPGDVLAGLLFGALVTVAGFVLTRRVFVWLVAALISTPLRVLLTRPGGDEPSGSVAQ